MPYQHVKVPADGDKITIQDGKLQVPDRPIIPFIEGDGTGPDIWRASVRVLDAAVAKAYGGQPEDRLDGGLRRARRPSSRTATGCPTRRSRPSGSSWWASRARSPPRSAAASAR